MGFNALNGLMTLGATPLPIDASPPSSDQYKAEEHTDPNTIPDDVADAAHIEHYEFAFGQDAEPLTRRELGISRQAWKCAIAVAIDKMNERP